MGGHRGQRPEAEALFNGPATGATPRQAPLGRRVRRYGIATADFRGRRRLAGRRFLMVAVGALGCLGTAWLAGFAMLGGRVPPWWALLVAVAGVAEAAGFAWLLAKVSHGGGWVGGAGREPAGRPRRRRGWRG